MQSRKCFVVKPATAKARSREYSQEHDRPMRSLYNVAQLATSTEISTEVFTARSHTSWSLGDSVLDDYMKAESVHAAC